MILFCYCNGHYLVYGSITVIFLLFIIPNLLYPLANLGKEMGTSGNRAWFYYIWKLIYYLFCPLVKYEKEPKPWKSLWTPKMWVMVLIIISSKKQFLKHEGVWFPHFPIFIIALLDFWCLAAKWKIHFCQNVFCFFFFFLRAKVKMKLSPLFYILGLYLILSPSRKDQNTLYKFR